MRAGDPIKILTSIYLSSFSSFQLMREMLNLFNQTSFTSIKKLQVFLEPQVLCILTSEQVLRMLLAG